MVDRRRGSKAKTLLLLLLLLLLLIAEVIVVAAALVAECLFIPACFDQDPGAWMNWRRRVVVPRTGLVVFGSSKAWHFLGVYFFPRGFAIFQFSFCFSFLKICLLSRFFKVMCFRGFVKGLFERMFDVLAQIFMFLCFVFRESTAVIVVFFIQGLTGSSCTFFFLFVLRCFSSKMEWYFL